MSIIIFIIVLALLILVHELGHFSFAKLFKMRVDEFGIGFPPRLWSRKKGETVYSVNAVPFGGFVKIFGEDSDGGQEDTNPRNFVNQSKPKQAMVLFAGVFFNLLFAWALLSFGFFYGLPASESLKDYGQVSNPKLLITSVSKNSPAEIAGLKTGDEILFAETLGGSLQGVNIPSEELQNLIANSDGNEITILYERKDKTNTAFVIPSYDIIPEKPAIGIVMDNVGILKLPVWKSLLVSSKMTFAIFGATFTGLGALLYDAFRGVADVSQVAGPVGIVGLIGDASSLGFAYLISFTALISINLAVINLIPFPALDGGRILFVGIEAIKGSRIKPVVANTLNLIGFVLLILLMVAVTFSDIYKILN